MAASSAAPAQPPPPYCALPFAPPPASARLLRPPYSATAPRSPTFHRSPHPSSSSALCSVTILSQQAAGLSRLTTDEKLQGAFAPFGRLLEAKVVTDRVSGRSKGFGFVRYATIEEAEKARQEMNAKFLDGWVIFVDPAKPRQPKPAPEQDTRSSHAGFTTNKTVGWCG
ncbi:unnamed protein product [Miscanthus lutarioriparius]|uniref:RRM domain-containing protein n=1 Tax=Miscanthus lutarioriparius TaxID=422564 RepID=A0A811MBC6_9POAL|nr:unnamed protein product [Miscanthus lutarioriparius]